MATWTRMVVVMLVAIGSSISGIIYYRIGQAALFPMARGEFSGPFTPAVELLVVIVPTALTTLMLGTVAWALAGGIQEEKARVRGRR